MIERGKVIEVNEWGTQARVESTDRPGIVTGWFRVLNAPASLGRTVAFVIFEDGTGLIFSHID